MAKHFLSYELDQQLLLPPDLKSWLPEGHLALFIADVVGSMDLTAFYRAHAGKDDRGRAAYHPQMMVTLLVYAYCVGKPPAVPDPEEAKPDPKLQRNFTDPESRIMPDGANKGSFLRGYNAQAAVDSEAQVR
jgi:hypothetical protein